VYTEYFIYYLQLKAVYIALFQLIQKTMMLDWNF